MRRRTFLATGAAAIATGLAGCSNAFGLRQTPDPWADAEASYPDDRSVPPEAETHHLYVENFDSDPYDVRLTVVRTDDETLVWRARYEAPDERGFEVPDLLVDGRSYRITLAIEGGEPASTELTVQPCRTAHLVTDTDETTTPPDVGGGSRNVGVWIQDATASFHQDNCDELRVGRLPIGNHDYFLLDD